MPSLPLESRALFFWKVALHQWVNNWCPTFWENYSSHLHGSKCSKRTQKIRPPGCPKTLGTGYPVMQGHIPDKQWPQPHCHISAQIWIPVG